MVDIVDDAVIEQEDLPTGRIAPRQWGCTRGDLRVEVLTQPSKVEDDCSAAEISASIVVLPEMFVNLECEIAGICSGATLIVIMRKGEFLCLFETDGRVGGLVDG